MVSFPASGIDSISLWTIIGVGFITGLLAGMLGMGGGFVRMPLLVYAIGMPTHVAVGTDHFEIMISFVFGIITHAVKGNVDVLMALARILICTSGAVLAEKVEETGAWIAYLAGAKVTLLHVAGAFPRMYSGLPETLTELLETDTPVAQHLHAAAAILAAHKVTLRLALRRGVVADEILRESAEGDYDLIVLGASAPGVCCNPGCLAMSPGRS